MMEKLFDFFCLFGGKKELRRLPAELEEEANFLASLGVEDPRYWEGLEDLPEFEVLENLESHYGSFERAIVAFKRLGETA